MFRGHDDGGDGKGKGREGKGRNGGEKENRNRNSNSLFFFSDYEKKTFKRKVEKLLHRETQLAQSFLSSRFFFLFLQKKQFLQIKRALWWTIRSLKSISLVRFFFFASLFSYFVRT